MRTMLFLMLAASTTAFARDTMHDGPVEGENSSVKMRLRTDTLIDRLSKSLGLNILLAHTHGFNHTLLIRNPGKHAQRVRFKPNDKLKIDLTNGQVVTIEQTVVSGIGAYVQGHAALIGPCPERECTEAWRTARLAALGLDEEADRVWRITGPANWNVTDPTTDAEVRNKIRATGTENDHHANAVPITYTLATPPDVKMKTLVITRPGDASDMKRFEIAEKGSFLFCEDKRFWKIFVYSSCPHY